MGTYRPLPLLTARRLARQVAQGTVGARQPLRVLVVDDHPAVRAALEGILGAEPDPVAVATAATARDALAQAERLAADVAVVDYHLPDEDGLSLTLQLKALPRPPRVLLYSAYLDAQLTVAAIVAGADGIANKGGNGDDLCQAIRAVARGRPALPHILPFALKAMAARLDPADAPILTMLVHDTPAAEIARALDITQAELDTRRWAILKRLTEPTGSDGEDHPTAPASSTANPVSPMTRPPVTPPDGVMLAAGGRGPSE